MHVSTGFGLLCAVGTVIAGPMGRHGSHDHLHYNHQHLHHRPGHAMNHGGHYVPANATVPSRPVVAATDGSSPDQSTVPQPADATITPGSASATATLQGFSTSNGVVYATSAVTDAITTIYTTTIIYTVGAGSTASETTTAYPVTSTFYSTEYVTVVVTGDAPSSPQPTGSGSAGSDSGDFGGSSSSDTTPEMGSAPQQIGPQTTYITYSPNDQATGSAGDASSSSEPQTSYVPNFQSTSSADVMTSSAPYSTLGSNGYQNATSTNSTQTGLNYHAAALYAADTTTVKKPTSTSSHKTTAKMTAKTTVKSSTSSKKTTVKTTSSVKSTSTGSSNKGLFLSGKPATTTTTTAKTTVKTTSSVKTTSTAKTSSTAKPITSVKTSSSAKSSSTVKTTSVPNKAVVKTSTSTAAQKSSSSTVAQAQTASAPGPTGTGTVAGCTKWYIAQSGDYCYSVAQKFGISTDTFMSWNPSVNPPSCSSMYANYAYCVATLSSSGSSGSSSSSAAAAASTLASSTGSYAAASTTSAAASSSTSNWVYKMYSGNGTVAAGWPAMSQWVDFGTMWSDNVAIMKQSCGNNGWGANDSDEEIADMKTAVQSIAASSGVDPRFILAIIMQESNGCVRVITTNYGVENPGLMQDHDGTGSCNRDGTVQSPCPASEITQMIKDGTEGTSSGDGLVQCIAHTGDTGVEKYYRAAHIYNGGTAEYNPDNLASGCCTLCYSSDVANRLMGWHTGSSGCTA